jgi:hypothetical protein
VKSPTTTYSQQAFAQTVGTNGGIGGQGGDAGIATNGVTGTNGISSNGGSGGAVDTGASSLPEVEGRASLVLDTVLTGQIAVRMGFPEAVSPYPAYKGSNSSFFDNILLEHSPPTFWDPLLPEKRWTMRYRSMQL